MPKGDGSTERAARPDRHSLLPGGGLVLAVLAVLLFAAARQVNPDALAPPPPEAPAAKPPSPSAWNPARVADNAHVADDAHSADDARVAEPVLDPLARHTLEDPVRLAHGGAYTLQLAVACRKETALGLLDRAAGANELYVLPTVAQGQDCYRFCWGTFDSRDGAARAVLPASLKGAGLGTGTPRLIHELTP